MTLGGYRNRVAWVDLTEKRVDYQPIPEDYATKYVGGRGLGVRFLYDVGPGIDPFSPQNPICFLGGALTGTAVPMSGRLCIVTRSPLTYTVTDSHQGGWSGARLRWAGLDGVVVTGRASRPVYLYIEDSKVEVRDAADLWGKNVHEVRDVLLERHGPSVSVVAIGRAGENLVRFAAVLNEHDRASGRGGAGAVMGSKFLKAIVIKAAEDLPQPADAGKFEEARARALVAIKESPVTSPKKGGLSVYGTNVLMNLVNGLGALPTLNARKTQFERAEENSGEWVREKILVEDPACHACPVACKKRVRADVLGFGELLMESVEYESAWAFGAQSGLAPADGIAYLVDRCNDYGLDTIEAGNALAMFMEATERGAVAQGLRWGDLAGMMETLGKITDREGIGDVLALGTYWAAAQMGVPELAMSVKGQAIPAYDPRGLQGMGLAYATSNRGACHVRGYTVASEVLGIPYKTDPLDWETKPELLVLLQNLHAWSDSADICKFSAFALTADDYAALYAGMVGIPYTAADVLRTGERVYNLERHYNNLNGFDQKDDRLPARFLTEPGTGPAQGHVCELAKMLKRYYELRGWEKGRVPEGKLRELGIV